jgi:hypothetical protein
MPYLDCVDCCIGDLFCLFDVSQTLSTPIDVDSQSDSGESDAGDDDQSSQFVDDLIVSPPMVRAADDSDSDGTAIFKRNLTREFDKLSKGCPNVVKKKVKVEKE